MKIKAILLCVLCIFLCSCGQSEKEITVEESDISEPVFQEVDGLWNCFQITECTLDTPEICVGSYCVYDGKVYYEVNYSEQLIDQTGRSENIPFEEKYNTEIRSHDMVSGTEEVIYKYSADWCVDIKDIVCNGKYLIWEDVDDVWKVNVLEVGTDTYPVVVVTGAQNEGDLWEIVPTVTEEDIYWYNKNGSDNNCISLYRYNFAKQEISLVRSGLDLTSPYTRLPITEGLYTMFARMGNNSCRIMVHNIQGEEEKVINVPTEVCRPISNQNYCVWNRGYDDLSSILFVYDFANQKTEKMDLSNGYSFSHALLGRYVIVNQRKDSVYGKEGLYCFDMVDKVYEQLEIEKTENQTLLYTSQGLDENVYLQIADDTSDFRIINIQIKSNIYNE